MMEIPIIVRFLHFLGAIIAVGAVLSTDLLNSYSLLHPEKFDYDIEVEELFSLLIWLGLFQLAVTGFLLFMFKPIVINSTGFQIKMFAVALLLLNGIFLNERITPKLEKIKSSKSRNLKEERKFELIAGISALISVISWLTALLIGYF